MVTLPNKFPITVHHACLTLTLPVQSAVSKHSTKADKQTSCTSQDIHRHALKNHPAKHNHAAMNNKLQKL
ncbi:hypothetical protein E2C01_030599 [Portunus trituberculatus]|uniref:Uncharacterized protein n=1 Tax=Portunus trituberculatus TaxID=210409 RepID=A0A5B7EUN2_PORTR|nr:hypothetical protein [Portunus trituberculatus]